VQMALGGEETDDPGQSGLGDIAFLQQSGTSGIGVAIELASRIEISFDDHSPAAFARGWHLKFPSELRGREGKEGSQDKVLQHQPPGSMQPKQIFTQQKLVSEDEYVLLHGLTEACTTRHRTCYHVVA